MIEQDSLIYLSHKYYHIYESMPTQIKLPQNVYIKNFENDILVLPAGSHTNHLPKGKNLPKKVNFPPCFW